VFMKRIRSLVFGLVYREPRYKDKRVSSLIYDLLPGRKPVNPLSQVPVPGPTDELLRVIEVAAAMPTTLWFQEDYQLPCLVACGQATLCYNLLKHIVRLHGSDSESYPPGVRQLWHRLLADRSALASDPYRLLCDLLPDADLPNPPGGSPSADGRTDG